MKKVWHVCALYFFLCFYAPDIFAQDTIVSTKDTTLTKYFIGNITLIGNKVTKDRILYRELTFQAGDTVDTVAIGKNFKRSEENLYNTSLFNSVKISWVIIPG
jgi:outer membrane protein assembly factor BamA